MNATADVDTEASIGETEGGGPRFLTRVVVVVANVVVVIAAFVSVCFFVFGVPLTACLVAGVAFAAFRRRGAIAVLLLFVAALSAPLEYVGRVQTLRADPNAGRFGVRDAAGVWLLNLGMAGGGLMAGFPEVALETTLLVCPGTQRTRLSGSCAASPMWVGRFDLQRGTCGYRARGVDVATYGNDAGDDGARREQRKKSIEAVIDASTDRTHRAGDTITSVGINVGLLGAAGATPLGNGTFFGPRALGGVSLPLGFSVEGLPGGCEGWLEYVGWRGSIHAFDLGQYVTVATNEPGLSRPRFDTSVAIGGQFGWLFAFPGDHMMPIFVGADVRYAPTLFSSSDPFSLAENGGSLQVGGMVGTSISFFDIN